MDDPQFILNVIQGVTALLSAVFAYLSWRASSASNNLAAPFVDGKYSDSQLTISIGGESSKHWEIREVNLIHPRDAQFLSLDTAYDDEGNITHYPATPLGRKILRIPAMLNVSGNPDNIQVRVVLSLRSSPKTKRRRVITISKTP